MKKLIFLFLVVAGLLILKPGAAPCVYCQGGTPCFSDTDCTLGCRCQAPPYFQGTCVQKF